jgi:hypothetical protein
MQFLVSLLTTMKGCEKNVMGTFPPLCSNTGSAVKSGMTKSKYVVLMPD